MNFSKKHAFTLVEVLVASIILSITVFGFYKLIGENTKLLKNSSDFLQVNMLFSPFEACIKEKTFSDFGTNSIGDTIHISFGPDLLGCQKDISSLPVILDSQEYFLDAKIIDKQALFINFELSIRSERTAVQKKSFRLDSI